MYSADRKRYSQELKPEQHLVETWDNPSKVVADLKRLGLGTIELAGRFVRKVVETSNKIP